MGKLDNRVALITGSDSGIGHASAVEFATHGADVVVNFLEDEQGAEQTKQGVEAHGRARLSCRPITATKIRSQSSSPPPSRPSARSTF